LRIVFAKFALDRLQLLSQEDFALGFAERFVDLALDLIA